MRTDAILKRLLALHPNKLIDLKLDRVERLLEQLGRPQDNLPPTIHVAGTNAKGSTIAHLRAMLEAAGNKVHVYSSPHLVSFRERIRLAGKLVSAKRLNKALEFCEQQNGKKPITYFEITTACAFYLFSQIKADYLLLEVGLGGRFDATNVIDKPLGSIITPVSIDHVEFLGDNLTKIAHEKAGIIKKKTPVVIGKQENEALNSIKKYAQKLNVTPYIFGENYDAYQQNGRLIYQDENGLLDLAPPRLKGAFQYENAGIAIAAIRHFNLPVDEIEINQGLKKVQWAGRLMPINSGELFKLLPKSHELWLDGGHNIAGAKALALAFQNMAVKNKSATNKKKLIIIMGSYANKDIKGFLTKFLGVAHEIIAIPINSDRSSISARDLAKKAEQLGFVANAERSISSALKTAAKTKNARVLICGSLHLVGDFLAENKTAPN